MFKLCEAIYLQIGRKILDENEEYGERSVGIAWPAICSSYMTPMNEELH